MHQIDGITVRLGDYFSADDRLNNRGGYSVYMWHPNEPGMTPIASCRSKTAARRLCQRLRGEHQRLVWEAYS